MGKKATFVKDRQRTIRHERERRDRVKRKNRSDDPLEAKRIAATKRSATMPKEEDIALLLRNPALAARLPKPARDLGLLLQAYRFAADSSNSAAAAAASSSSSSGADAVAAKRVRKEEGQATASERLAKEAALKAFAAVTADDTVAIELVFDESGAMVLSALVRSLAHAGLSAELARLLEVFTKVSDDGSDSLLLRMAEHHFARSVVWAAVEVGDEATQAKIFSFIVNGGKAATAPAGGSAKKAAAKSGASPAAAAVVTADPARIKEMAVHRHGAIALQKFIQHFAASRGPISAALTADVEGFPTFAELLKNPISAPVVQSLTVNSDASGTVTEALFNAAREAGGGVRAIVEDPKRGPRVLLSMLGETPTAASAAIAQSVYDELGAADLVTMVKDSQKNFLFQRVLKHATPALQKTLFDAVAKSFTDFAMHGVGVHVCIAFATIDNDEVRKAIVNTISPAILDLVRHRHGGLFLRKLIEHAGSVGQNLMQVLEKDIPALIFDASGNLVVQQLIQQTLAPRPAAERAKFYERFVKPDLLQMCQHQFAAHVVVKLLEVLDAQVVAEIGATLRPHIVTLLQHVNGRFVVDRLIGPFKDIRDLIAARFADLSQLKGTQHALVRVYEVSDKKARAALVRSLLPRAMQMACNQQSTLVIQKLIQLSRSGEIKDDGFFADEMKKCLNINALRQDFFGKFVAQLLQ